MIRAAAFVVLTVAAIAHAEPAPRPAAPAAKPAPKAQKPTKADEAVAAVKALIDRSDAALKAFDAPAMIALLDEQYFATGPRASSKNADLASAKKSIERGYARLKQEGISVTRDGWQLQASDGGDVVWFVIDYSFTAPAKASGGEPVKRPFRESGVARRRGGAWKLAMLSSAAVLPDEPAKK